MSEKFVVNGGLSVPTGQDITIGANGSLFFGSDALSAVNTTDYSTNGALATTDAAKNSIPSEYSVATYVNAQLGASNQLNIATDTDGEYDTEILLASETLSALGGSNITTKMSAHNQITIDLDATVSGLTSLTSTTITDGTASMSSGNITGLGNLTGTADNMLLVAGDDTEYDFSGDDAGTIAIQADASSSGIKLRSNTDINGTLAVSSNIDVDGTANLDDVDIDGSTQVDGTIIVGANDTGYDVTFYGATAGKKMMWDEDVDTLIVDGTTDLNGTLTISSAMTASGNADFNGELDVAGATSLAASNTLTDIRGTLSVDEAATFDSTVQLDGAVTVGANTTGLDVTMHGKANGANMLWDATNDKLHLTKSYIEMDNSARKDFLCDVGSAGEDVIVSYPKATFEGAEIVMRSTDGTDRTCKKVLVTNTSSAASLVVYGTVNSNSTTGDIIGDLAVAINGDNVEVKLAAGNTSASDGDAIKGTIDLIKA